ncbi:aspartate kinase [Actinoplanes sp. CA-015351]|uniref:aspartate kinase n=1 Tax=Actinoplanes sp. CA-015351 TaxID=3239897 RepID=UPI003D97A9A3
MKYSDPIVVQKYGGSSLATVEKIAHVAGVVARTAGQGRPVVVVVSARGDTTDELLHLTEQITPAPPARELDQLLATGETVSAALLAMALTAQGVPAASLTAAQAGIRAAGRHGTGTIAGIDTGRVRSLLADGLVVVITGFQAVDEHGDVLTLGRGGSDTTAVAVAAELGADRCEIYTDVDGIYTADPRLVPHSRRLPSVPSAVMTEMAFGGAGVMHSRAVELAALSGVDIEVRSSQTAEPGTTVLSVRTESLEDRGAVLAITHDRAVARVLVQARTDVAAQVFGTLGRCGVAVDLVARSGSGEPEFRMGFTVRRDHLDRLLGPLRAAVAPAGGRVDVDAGVGKVSLIGTGLLNRPEIVARMLTTLNQAGIATSWVSATQLRTSVTVPLPSVGDAVAVLHEQFGLAHDDYDLATPVPS